MIKTNQNLQAFTFKILKITTDLKLSAIQKHMEKMEVNKKNMLINYKFLVSIIIILLNLLKNYLIQKIIKKSNNKILTQ